MAASLDHDSRVCVYPCYINSAKTGSQGRKLPVDKSVENPTTPEIYDVVQKIIKLPAEIERKRHPRDWMYLGRVRVQLKDSESGELLHKDIPSRKALMLKITESLPKQASMRSSSSGKGGQMAPAAAEVSSASSSSAPAAASGGVGSLPSRKKAGKKKK